MSVIPHRKRRANIKRINYKQHHNEIMFSKIVNKFTHKKNRKGINYPPNVNQCDAFFNFVDLLIVSTSLFKSFPYNSGLCVLCLLLKRAACKLNFTHNALPNRTLWVLVFSNRLYLKISTRSWVSTHLDFVTPVSV